MNGPYRIGLTGSIGMGKSTTAQMFAEHGDVAVWDADAAVHRLYAPGGKATRALGNVFPQAIDETGVNRALLKSIIAADQTALKQIEAIVHPLVQQDRAEFLAGTQAPIAVLDIPLLFETGADREMDRVVVVSCPPQEQRRRVLARGMTPEQFELILRQQMPDREKRSRADDVIETVTLEAARAKVCEILERVREAIDA